MNINLFVKLFIILILVFTIKTSFAQLGVNGTGAAPASNAMLDVVSTNKGVLLPRIANPASIPSPTAGMLFYNTSTNQYNFFNGSIWNPLTNAAAGTGWGLSGTNIYSANTGNVGIGTTTPSAKLDLVGTMQIIDGTQAAGRSLMSDAQGNAAWREVPELVNFKGVYSAVTSYNINDLVVDGLGNYYYSLLSGNLSNNPASLPNTNWQQVQLEQLKVIHKQLTLSTPGFTSLCSFHLTGTNSTGGRVFYTIRATDGGSQIATEQGVIQYLATSNTITCNVQVTDKLHLGTVNSGCTPGFYNPLSQPGISVFDNVSFSSPASIVLHDVYFRIVGSGGNFDGGIATKTGIRLEF